MAADTGALCVDGLARHAASQRLWPTATVDVEKCQITRQPRVELRPVVASSDDIAIR